MNRTSWNEGDRDSFNYRSLMMNNLSSAPRNQSTTNILENSNNSSRLKNYNNNNNNNNKLSVDSNEFNKSIGSQIVNHHLLSTPPSILKNRLNKSSNSFSESASEKFSRSYYQNHQGPSSVSFETRKLPTNILGSSSAMNTPTRTPIGSDPNRSNQRIPISLNPELIRSGLKIGSSRLMEKIRINLIFLILIHLFSLTKFYNHLKNQLIDRFTSLSNTFSILEYLIVLILVINLVQAYYKLQTLRPVTHLDLPLTPQQIRGSLRPHPSTTPTKKVQTMRSHSNLRSSTNEESSLQSNSISRRTDESQILSFDPLMNHLSKSTNQLFKRSLNSSLNSTNNSNNSNNDNNNNSNLNNNSNHHSKPMIGNSTVNVKEIKSIGGTGVTGKEKVNSNNNIKNE